MKKIAQALFVLAVMVAGVGSSPSFGQVTTGTPPLGSFAGDPDIINLANLNAHITVPMVSKPGRGLPFSYALGYDTSVWYPLGVSGSQTWQPVGNWGWTGQTQVTTGYVSFSIQIVIFPTGCEYAHSSVQIYSNITYHDSFGIPHPFSGTDQFNPDNCPGYGSTGFSGTTADGSGYSISIPDGQILEVQIKMTSRTGWSLNVPAILGAANGSATDSNGNQITVTASGVFTDTLGTTALTVSGSPPSNMVFTYTAPSGSASYKVIYTSKTVQTNFGCSGIAEFAATSVPLVTEIDLPDGVNKYLFTYEATPGFPGNVTGRLASVTYPTGGEISYAYSGGNAGIICADGSTATLERTTPDTGTNYWKYVHSESGTAWSTTVTDPTNNATVLNFQGIYETERQVYSGPASGTPIETITTCYNNVTTGCNAAAITLPISQKNATLQWPGGVTSSTSTSFNVYGLVTENSVYGPGSTALQTTTIQYASLGNNIVAQPGLISVSSPNDALVSSTSYGYDEGGAPPPPPVTPTPQHVSITGSRGNPTTVSYYVSGTTLPTYVFLSRYFTYYDTGNVATATDVNGAITSYNYPSETTSCGNAFPTSVSLPLSLSISMTWNCNGGIQASATDANGNTSSVSYSDPDYWRPSSAKDPTNAVTSFTYANINRGESSLPFNGSTSVSDALNVLDSLGRTQVQQAKQSQSATIYDSIETQYDAIGRPYRVTLPYSAAAGTLSSSAPASIYSYDALNRVTSVTDAGGGSSTYSYSANDVLITNGPPPPSENAKAKQLEYDSLGRLTSVCEITSSLPGSGTCGQTITQTGYWTKYGYDPNGNLISVSQSAQSGTAQSRSYTYDGLSRLTSENNPESGPTTYVYDTDTTCATTFNGDLVKKIDANGNVICYAYDALHRPLSVKYPSGPNSAKTSCKFYVYDVATVNSQAMLNAKGQEAEVYTTNCQNNTKVTDIGFSYSTRGEVAEVYESTPNSNGYYKISATYWANGALDQMGGLLALPTLTYTPDGEGRPAIVSAGAGQNPVTSTLYNSASLPTSMILGSNDSDAFTYDPNTNRMTQFKFNVNSQALTGTLGWNAVGTPATLNIVDGLNSNDTQSCTFAHDDLVRIAKVNCGTIWGQSFTYDAFGNITKNVLPGDGGISFASTYSAATNHIATIAGVAPTYDNNGNLTKDPMHQYTVDAEGRPVAIDSITFVYDAMNRLVEQTASGVNTQTVYDPLGEKIGLMHGQTLLRAFAPLPDGGIAAYTSSGLTYYRHPDFLGSSRLASTATPPTSSYGDNAYAPYGESYAQSGTPDLSFTGQNQDTGLGLYDFQFREMNPTQGRWIAPDPAGVSAVNLADPQTLNRYVYVRSSPLIAVDNLGLDTTCITTDIKFLYYVNDQPIYQFTYLCQTTGGGGTAGSGGGGVGRGAAGAPGTKNPRCKLSLRQRISLGIQGGLNLYLGSSKVVDGAGEALVGLGLAPETGGASVAVTAAGGYTMVSGGGQAATGTFQLNRAVSGNGGPETTGEQNAAIASGPISGTLVLASGFGPSNAEAAANFESIFSIGTGLVNSPDVSGLIDAGLTYLGVSDSGGCR